MFLKCKSAEDAFHKILDSLQSDGIESNPRGLKIKELINVNVEIENPRDRIITCPERKFSSSYAFGELAWYLSARNDLDTMSYYSSRMANGTDDGLTLNSAYGYRIFSGNHPKIGFDQWENVLRLFKNDKDTRQAIIHLHTANEKKTNDEVCTLSLQFFVRNNKLDMITTMRSNDVVLGFTYDVFQFTMLQEMMLNDLKKIDGFENLELGKYYHNVGSMHLYLNNFYKQKSFDFFENGHTKNELLPMQPFDFTKDELRDKIVKFERMARNAYFLDKQFDDFNLDFVYSVMNDIDKEDSSLCSYFKASFLFKYVSKLDKYNYEFKNKIIECLNNKNETYAEILSYQTNFSQNKNMIIVEGVDGVGKTFFINKLISENECLSSYRIRHFIKMDDPTSFSFEKNYLSVLSSKQDTICDRFVFSEQIYGNVLRKDKTKCYTQDEMNNVLNKLSDKKQETKIFVLVASDVNKFYENLNYDDKQFLTKENYEKINKQYEELYFTLCKKGFDVTLVKK